MTNIRRRQLVRATSATIVAAAFAGRTAAQDYPARPVKLIVPFLAGGVPDQFARTLAERLGKAMGQPFVVENKPGASGLVGAELVAGSPPDGYALLFGITSLIQLPSLMAKVPYDPVRSFAPISHLGGTHLALAVNATTPVRTVREFVDYVKARPGQLTFGSYGAGSSSHLFGEILNESARLDLTHVAYKGDGPALIDLMGGRIFSSFSSVSALRPHVATGKLTMIAVTGPNRSPLMPDVPTFGEQGVSGLDAQGWFGLLAPAGTPVAIVDRLSAECGRIIAESDVAARLRELGIMPAGSTPAQFAELMGRDRVIWDRIIRAKKITLE